jgi:hypothetical protein
MPALNAYWWHTGEWDDDPPRRVPTYTSTGKSLQFVACVPLGTSLQLTTRLAGCDWALNAVYTSDEDHVVVYRRVTTQKKCTAFS